jgi:NADH dehydrogenase
MILIAGGTGTLGTRLIERLGVGGVEVRVLTRHPQRHQQLQHEHVELIAGDLSNRPAVDRATAGAPIAISAAQGGFGATDGPPPHRSTGTATAT